MTVRTCVGVGIHICCAFVTWQYSVVCVVPTYTSHKCGEDWTQASTSAVKDFMREIRIPASRSDTQPQVYACKA